MSVRSLVLTGAFFLQGLQAPAQDLPPLAEVRLKSTLDSQSQPVRYWVPESATKKPTVLFVFLHSWSSDYKQTNDKWLRCAVEQGWIYLHPNFRGANRTPQACGSKWARQDVLDAMDWAMNKFKVDTERVYLCGVSGGGHMTMLMSGHHPDRFSAASAWVGISDIASWYRFHTKDGTPTRYAQMILGCFQHPPGHSKAVDADYKDRSPLFHIHRATSLPVDIFAGVNDGHTGSVPVRHSLDPFNRIAKAHGNPQVSEEEIQQLTVDRKLKKPGPTDQGHDADLDREILLRRISGPSRVTIFDGGHESVPAAAINWLSKHRRETRRAESGE